MHASLVSFLKLSYFVVMDERGYPWPVRTVSSAVGTQAELGSVPLESGHSQATKSRPTSEFSIVIGAWYERTKNVAGFF